MITYDRFCETKNVEHKRKVLIINSQLVYSELMCSLTLGNGLDATKKIMLHRTVLLYIGLVARLAKAVRQGKAFQ